MTWRDSRRLLKLSCNLAGESWRFHCPWLGLAQRARTHGWLGPAHKPHRLRVARLRLGPAPGAITTLHPLEVPADPPKICQLRSNSQAFSTKVSSVVGCGESIRSLFCRAGGSAHRKAHILVVSSTPVHLAWVLHSRNQVAKSLAPIEVSCIFAMASIWAASGMNCLSKAALKSFHVP